MDKITNAIIKGIFLLCIILASHIAEGRMIRIGIIDTGYDFESKWSHPDLQDYVPKKICGTYNSLTNTTDTKVPDLYPHGTHVTSVLAKYLNDHNVNYCIFIIKFMDKEVYLDKYLSALTVANMFNLDILNISIAGIGRRKGECEAIKNIINSGTIVVTAAGNDSLDLSKVNSYPAMCDKRVYKVLNVKENGKLSSSSNFTSKPMYRAVKELGTNIVTLHPGNTIMVSTGTSLSAPLFAAKLAEKMYKEKK